LTKKDSLLLERFLRLAAKSIQKLPTRTRTDMALALLGWRSFESLIDKRKLCFVPKLCQMPNDCLTKHIFDMRLNMFMLKGAKHQLGFIPDICKILVKYGLFKYLNDYIQFSEFPTKWT
jgi:hypothetical protein